MANELFPLNAAAKIHHNLRETVLIEHAVLKAEGKLAKTGAFCAETGQHTGRSPNDKFVVRDAETEGAIWWDNSKSMTREQFDVLLADFTAFAKTKELYV